MVSGENKSHGYECHGNFQSLKKRQTQSEQPEVAAITLLGSVFDVITPREVAQLGRALGLGPRGRRFESCLPDLTIFGAIVYYSLKTRNKCGQFGH